MTPRRSHVHAASTSSGSAVVTMTGVRPYAVGDEHPRPRLPVLRGQAVLPDVRVLDDVVVGRDELQVVLQRHERIKDIFQPGVMATLEVNDGRVTTPFASATIEVLAAEALLPLE